MQTSVTQNQSKLFALVLSFLLILFLGATAARADGLGISVAVVPYSDASGLTAGGNDRLWYPIEPGQSFVREIRITSYSDLRQVVSVQTFDFVTENGVRSTDFSKASLIGDWLDGDAVQGVLIEPGETITLPITVSVPAEAVQRAYEGTLRVLATEFNDGIQPERGEGVQAIVEGAVAIDLSFWIGVGDALALVPSFDIADIEGVLIGNLKYLRIYFENTGLSPLRLRGSAQFSDPQFVERVYEPAIYISPQISSGERGHADVLIDQEIVDGNWNVFVVAEQDGIRQTKLFEGNLRFVEPGSLPAWVGMVVQIAIGLLSLVGALVGLRTLRNSRTQSVSPERSETSSRDKSMQKAKFDLKLPKLVLTGLIRSIRAIGDTVYSKTKERATRPKSEKPALVIQKPERQKIHKPGRPKAHRPSRVEKSFEGRVQSLIRANQTVREFMGEDIKDAVFKAEMAEKYPQGNYKFDMATLDASAQARVGKILEAKRIIRELQTDELRIEVIRRETDAKLERMRQGSRL